MNPLVDQFTQETGIKVNVQPFSEDLYFDKMEQVLRATPGGADVYFLPMDSTAFAQFNAGLIEPLTPYLNDPTKTASDYDLKDFPQGFQDPGMYPPGDASAQLYGIPISFETYILFYNKDLVAKYSAASCQRRSTSSSPHAEKITKDGRQGRRRRGRHARASDPTRSWTRSRASSMTAWGAKEAPPPYGLWFDGGWDKPRLTDPAVCAGMANYAKLLAAGPANKFAIDWPDANTLFSQGKAAFFIDASLFGPVLRGRRPVAGRRQGRLLGAAAGVGRRRVVHRPLAVGPRDPEERPEQGRRLVLHPVDDEQGEHGQDRQPRPVGRHGCPRTPIRSTRASSSPST